MGHNQMMILILNKTLYMNCTTVADITQTGDGYYRIIIFHSVFPWNIMDPILSIYLHALLNRYELHVEKLILLSHIAAFA